MLRISHHTQPFRYKIPKAIYQQESNIITRSIIAPSSSVINQYQRKYLTMDPSLSRAASTRITALFSRDSQPKGVMNFAEKNRSKELKRLSKVMEMDVPQLKELLKNQMQKMESDSPKALYIEWIIDESSGNRVNSSKRRKESDAEEKKSDAGDFTEGSQTVTPQPKKSRVIRPTRPTTAEERTREEEKEELAESAIQDPNLLTSTLFENIEGLHPASKRAIKEVLKLKSMTEIQQKTYDAASSGQDVLGRARTGTGKTMAFLLPALQSLLSKRDYVVGSNIGILIVSPTRELATQIGDQAEKLLSFHRNMRVQVVFGGTKITKDINTLNRNVPTVLVATPGRLLDHLENTKIGSRQFGHDIMRETPILVLDETDRLLDMGFRREIKKILAYLPRTERRQTLLFSATVPDELKQIMSENMKKDYIEVDCIGDNAESSSHTNLQVEQSHVVLPSMDRYVSSVVQIVKRTMNTGDSPKIVVFFPAARLVGFFADFFNTGLGIEVIELHSKKSQGYRNKASDKFRKAKCAVLFTSDVSARGVDYPDVTDVLQFGLPESKDQYIHRLGRTGRAGKTGKGLIVLSPFEAKFLSDLKGLDVPLNVEMNNFLKDPVDRHTLSSVDDVMNMVKNGDKTLSGSAKQAYQAFLGYYLGQIKRTNFRAKTEIVQTANFVSTLMGLDETPGLLARTVGKMGLKGVPGIRIEKGGMENQGGARQGGRNNSRGRR